MIPCEHCGKAKVDHFYRYEKQYDEGLRDNYYCKKYGVVRFKGSQNLKTTEKPDE